MTPLPDGPALFRSPLPRVRLVGATPRPYDTAVAAARTCYSAKGIVSPSEVGADSEADPTRRAKRLETRDRIARSIFEAGHHTTLQHAHFTFAIENVSRQFLWSFLHAHPFYNSEQVSQRYVEVKPGAFAVPALSGEALSVYERAMEAAQEAYRDLSERLAGPAEAEYLKRFPGRAKDRDRLAREVQRRAQEAARYVLPVSTFAFLYHTVSALTLLRYARASDQYDAPGETRIVVDAMRDAAIEADPALGVLFEPPIPIERTPEALAYAAGGWPTESERAAARRSFDASLGARASLLVDPDPAGEARLAAAVREVLGLPAARLSDDDAIALVLDPSRNAYLDGPLNLSSLSKIMRAGVHVRYTFRKRLSHTADSQDQRHRMAPGSRPLLSATVGDEPDVVAPALILANESVESSFREAIARSWEAFRTLKRLGVPAESALYALPNALAVRFTESADLLSLRHKMVTRLCVASQEEIRRASVDEWTAIRAVHPRIGAHLAPPCALRERSGKRPYCPEGERFCGVPAWRLPVEALAGQA
ncbi:MAG: FAD-dependent thymidylate synthase [Planctomycetota bacterium]